VRKLDNRGSERRLAAYQQWRGWILYRPTIMVQIPRRASGFSPSACGRRQLFGRERFVRQLDDLNSRRDRGRKVIVLSAAATEATPVVPPQTYSGDSFLMEKVVKTGKMTGNEKVSGRP
jgi:hypothetical protein